MTMKQTNRLILAACLSIVWPACAQGVKPLGPEDFSSPDYDLKLNKARQELSAEREQRRKLEQEAAAGKKRVRELELTLKNTQSPIGETILPSWLFQWSWQNGGLAMLALLALWGWLSNWRTVKPLCEDDVRMVREALKKKREELDTSLSIIQEVANHVSYTVPLLKPTASPATHFFQDTFLDGSGQGPEMVIVPAGKFLMGSSPDEKDHSNNEDPQHTVSIARPFAVGKYPVTRGQFAAFVRETRYNIGNKSWTYEDGKAEKHRNRNWQAPGYQQSDDHPVVCVNRDDVKAYVVWLSGKTGKAYRLLSEAEWEYAGRAGERHTYCGGNDIGALAWYNGNSDGKTHPVGRKQANAWGLHDMSGNVWEWVEDCWHDNYQGAPIDGSAWTSGKCDVRVVRGGSWYYIPVLARAAVRNRFDSSVRNFNTGFRLARMLP